MPNYVCLFDWTDQQGVRNAKDSPSRYDEAAARMAQEKYGVRIRQNFWTVGLHDRPGLLRRGPALRAADRFHEMAS